MATKRKQSKRKQSKRKQSARNKSARKRGGSEIDELAKQYDETAFMRKYETINTNKLTNVYPYIKKFNNKSIKDIDNEYDGSGRIKNNSYISSNNKLKNSLLIGIKAQRVKFVVDDTLNVKAPNTLNNTPIAPNTVNNGRTLIQKRKNNYEARKAAQAANKAAAQAANQASAQAANQAAAQAANQAAARHLGTALG
jgi:hypothetical protein